MPPLLSPPDTILYNVLQHIRSTSTSRTSRRWRRSRGWEGEEESQGGRLRVQELDGHGAGVEALHEMARTPPSSHRRSWISLPGLRFPRRSPERPATSLSVRPVAATELVLRSPSPADPPSPPAGTIPPHGCPFTFRPRHATMGRVLGSEHAQYVTIGTCRDALSVSVA